MEHRAKEARLKAQGFSAGMSECWKDGIMGQGRITMKTVLLEDYPYPALHYSNIPSFRFAACCQLLAASWNTLFSMPYALCPLPHAPCPWGWLRFCISEIPQTPNPSETRLKKENRQFDYLCYCFLNKNDKFFFFVMFLWGWKETNISSQSIIDNRAVELSEKYLTF